MIAADTSSLRRFLSGATGHDVDTMADAVAHRSLVLPPVVLTEILSDRSADQTASVLTAIPLLEITEGYWGRAGLLRARVIAAGHKSKVAAALIAQSCLDHDVALVTNDRNFRHYERYGLVLL
ncbi:MAG TPA: PIN domain-containing protein [Thermoanaerobaculia bacterium]|nr:PIN domain-containing protein [Thermoanaerobaculia bacterium]